MNLSNIKTVVISADVSGYLAAAIVKQIMSSELNFVRVMANNEKYPADMDLLIMSNPEYHTYQDQVGSLPYECIPAYLAKSTIKEIIKSQKGNKTMSILNKAKQAAKFTADVNVLNAKVATDIIAEKGYTGVAAAGAALLAGIAVNNTITKFLKTRGFNRTARVIGTVSSVNAAYCGGLVGLSLGKVITKK